jgi:hypothetical protein
MNTTYEEKKEFVLFSTYMKHELIVKSLILYEFTQLHNKVSIVLSILLRKNVMLVLF